jgi:hypothetical protein
MLRAALVAVLLAASGAPASAAGERDASEPPVGAAVGTGGGVAFVTVLAGSLLFSTSDDGLHRTGVYVAMAGLTLAPAIAHVMAREYKRAVYFSIAPLVSLVANTVVMQIDPTVTTLGSPETRVTLGVALTIAALGATIGIADLFAASDRWRARHRVMVAPAIVPGGAGVGVGARF